MLVCEVATSRLHELQLGELVSNDHLKRTVGRCTRRPRNCHTIRILFLTTPFVSGYTRTFNRAIKHLAAGVKTSVVGFAIIADDLAGFTQSQIGYFTGTNLLICHDRVLLNLLLLFFLALFFFILV
jgi:hypothetical protein